MTLLNITQIALLAVGIHYIIEAIDKILSIILDYDESKYENDTSSHPQ